MEVYNKKKEKSSEWFSQLLMEAKEKIKKDTPKDCYFEELLSNPKEDEVGVCVK